MRTSLQLSNEVNGNDGKRYLERCADSVDEKLSPKLQVKNPVMLLVYVGAILATSLYFLGFFGISDEKSGYTLAIALILWFTVLFANFAEAIAEGRGRAQADSLKMARKDVLARKLKNIDDKTDVIEIASNDLKKATLCMSLRMNKFRWMARLLKVRLQLMKVR